MTAQTPLPVETADDPSRQATQPNQAPELHFWPRVLKLLSDSAYLSVYRR